MKKGNGAAPRPAAKKAAREPRRREAGWGYMAKRISAYGGCLGGERRRRARQPAKSVGEAANGL